VVRIPRPAPAPAPPIRLAVGAGRFLSVAARPRLAAFVVVGLRPGAVRGVQVGLLPLARGAAAGDSSSNCCAGGRVLCAPYSGREAIERAPGRGAWLAIAPAIAAAAAPGNLVLSC
jgi:hypothetical protein